METIKVVILHNSTLICDLISDVLSDEEGITVLASVTTYQEAIPYLPDADIVLINSHLPNRDGIDVVSEINGQFEDLKVVAIGLDQDKKKTIQYIEAGADAVVHQDESVDDMVEKIEAAYQEKAYITPEVAYQLMQKVAHYTQVFEGIDVGQDELSLLTDREREILQNIASGFTNREIGEKLYIELGTVKNHVHNILEKLNVHSREDASAYLAVVKSRRI